MGRFLEPRRRPGHSRSLPALPRSRSSRGPSVNSSASNWRPKQVEVEQLRPGYRCNEIVLIAIVTYYTIVYTIVHRIAMR